jgi:hypothetical protein
LAGQLVGLDSTGKMVLADADAATPIPAVGVAVVDVAIGGKGSFTLLGKLKNSAWSFTPGAKLYASGTAGAFTATAPSTAGNLVQPVGFARSATEVVFNVAQSATVVQAAGNSTVAFG